MTTSISSPSTRFSNILVQKLKVWSQMEKRGDHGNPDQVGQDSWAHRFVPCLPGKQSLTDCPVVQSSGINNGQCLSRAHQSLIPPLSSKRIKGMKCPSVQTRDPQYDAITTEDCGRIFRHQHILVYAQMSSEPTSSKLETGQGHRGQRGLLLWP